MHGLNARHGRPSDLAQSPLRLGESWAKRDKGDPFGLGTVSGMRACGAGHYGRFDTKTADTKTGSHGSTAQRRMFSEYEDNVVSWPSVEPADDYTANSLLAFAFAAADR